jgi:hypothetical protein
MTSANLTNGFTKIPNWWWKHADINGDRLSVLTILSGYADIQTHSCWPSQSTIATQLGRSRAWVNGVLKQLVELGFISKTYRKRKDNNGTTSCLYRVKYDEETLIKDNKSEHISSDEIMTGGVNEIDTNNIKNNNTNSKFCNKSFVRDWTCSSKTYEEMKSITLNIPNFDIEKYKENFRVKIILNGYKYQNLDFEILKWLKEDINNNKFKQTKNTKRQNFKKPNITKYREKQVIFNLDKHSDHFIASHEELNILRKIKSGEKLNKPISLDMAFSVAKLLVAEKRSLNEYQSEIKNLSYTVGDGDILFLESKHKFLASQNCDKYGPQIQSVLVTAGFRFKACRAH